jgi:hypothetical protein
MADVSAEANCHLWPHFELIYISQQTALTKKIMIVRLLCVIPHLYEPVIFLEQKNYAEPHPHLRIFYRNTLKKQTQEIKCARLLTCPPHDLTTLLTVSPT